jgi:hypothetical protein
MASTEHRLELANSAANDAIRGIAMQHHRLASELPEDEKFFAGAGFRREVDLQLLLVLVVRLRRVVGLGVELATSGALRADLAEFDQRFPAANHMRNISEHLDDYIEGKGHRQTSAPAGSLGVRVWGASPGGDVTFEWAGETIDLGQLRAAADQLYRSLRLAIDAPRGSY